MVSFYTISDVSEMLAFYIEAEKRVLAGKSITKDGRTWTRENLNEIRRGRQEWQAVYNNKLRGSSGPSLVRFD